MREAWSADQWNESFVLLLLKVIIWLWDVPSVSIDSSLVRVTFLYVSLGYIFSLRLLVKIIQFFVATNRSALAPSGPGASTFDACSFTVSFAFWSSPRVQSGKEKEESDTGRKDESFAELYSRRRRFASKLWLRVKSKLTRENDELFLNLTHIAEFAPDVFIWGASGSYHEPEPTEIWSTLWPYVICWVQFGWMCPLCELQHFFSVSGLKSTNLVELICASVQKHDDTSIAVCIVEM